jgi:hypothetical protein
LAGSVKYMISPILMGLIITLLSVYLTYIRYDKRTLKLRLWQFYKMSFIKRLYGYAALLIYFAFSFIIAIYLCQ